MGLDKADCSWLKLSPSKYLLLNINVPWHNFASPNTTLVIYIYIIYTLVSLMRVSLQHIKHILKNICRCSVKLTEIFVGDIFILFWCISNEIAFSRAVLIKTVALYEKANAAPAALLNLPETTYKQRKPVSKSLQLNFVNKFTIII